MNWAPLEWRVAYHLWLESHSKLPATFARHYLAKPYMHTFVCLKCHSSSFVYTIRWTLSLTRHITKIVIVKKQIVIQAAHMTTRKNKLDHGHCKYPSHYSSLIARQAHDKWRTLKWNAEYSIRHQPHHRGTLFVCVATRNTYWLWQQTVNSIIKQPLTAATYRTHRKGIKMNAAAKQFIKIRATHP